MSAEEATDIKITIKKWMIGSIVAIGLALFTATGVVINFYYHTNDAIENLSAKLEDFEDKITRHEVTLGNKVSIEEMREFKSDMKNDMKDIKNLLNILLEKR